MNEFPKHIIDKISKYNETLSLELKTEIREDIKNLNRDKYENLDTKNVDNVIDILIEAGSMTDGTLQEIEEIVEKRLELVRSNKKKV